MNKILISLLATLLLFTSCENFLNTEVDPSTHVYYAAATLTYVPSGENIFITDDSLYLYPTSKITIPDLQKDSLLNQRYYITFQIEENSSVSNNVANINLLSMQMMYTKTIIEIDSIDELQQYKNQQLSMQQLWTSGSYLNFITSITGSGYTPHNYHLIYNTENSSSDTIYLTLRYDNNNDSPIYNLQNALSYNLSKYLNKSNNDSITICFNYNSNIPAYNTLFFKIKNQ